MKKVLFVLPLIPLLFTGCDQKTTQKATQQAQQTINDLNDQGRKLLNPDSKDETKGAVEADSVINRRVSEAISNDSSLANELNTLQISTQDGVVTLKGTVSTSDQIDKIVSKVKGVKGVKSVNNQLTAASRKGDGSGHSDTNPSDHSSSEPNQGSEPSDNQSQNG